VHINSVDRGRWGLSIDVSRVRFAATLDVADPSVSRFALAQSKPR
jgi:hypothetical protein